MRIRIITAVPLLLAGCGYAHAGNYYKWTDAQGSVHYSQTPPSGHASETVFVNDGAPGTLPLEGKVASSEQKAKVQAGQNALQKADTETVAANCAAAQQNIKRLQNSGMVVSGDDGSNAHALDPQAREQALTDARNQAATYCAHKP